MVADGYHTCDHNIRYTNVKSLSCTPEANITLYIHSTLIIKQTKKPQQKTTKKILSLESAEHEAK